MSESTILISEVKQIKEGNSKRGHWTLYGIIDGNDEIFGTWLNDSSIRDAAKELVGEKADIEWEPNAQDGTRKTIKGVKPAADPEQEVSMGTRAKMDVSEARRILLCVAWERANELARIQVEHTTSRELTPQLIFDIAREHRGRIFTDLLRESGLMTDEDIPFEIREVEAA